MIPALLKWIGNKQRFAETIVSYMPNHFINYYEPFLGSGAVMAELLHSDRNMMTLILSTPMEVTFFHFLLTSLPKIFQLRFLRGFLSEKSLLNAEHL